MGIKEKFKITLITEPIIATFINITCRPHICNKFPAAPEKETNTLPIDNNINANTPSHTRV